MSCKNCGAQISPGRKFCTECGALAPEAPTIACSVCSNINPADAKFCWECGRAFAAGDMAKPGSRETALDAPESGWEMPAAERRQLTVQFCDLVGSTELSTRLDPEDLREIVSAYHRCVANTVARFDGYVAKYMGDGVLVYFGYPLAHEDDAERAVRAGLALADTVGQIAAPERLRVRVGIATGPVVVGDLIGSGEAKERRVIGETPNLAARLQALAQPGDVVIAQSTRRLVGDLFEYRDLGAVEIKGFAASVSASQVLRGGATESRFEAVRSTETLTPLVGRKVELAILLDRWQRAKHGEGQVVLISAEPGIGKSRLIASLVNERLQAEPSYIRLRYFCSLHHTASALYPIVAQLERAAGITRNDASDIKLDKLEAVLARTSPPVEDVALLADLLSVPASDRYPSLNFTPQRKREKTLEALIAQLIALARQQPVLMIFEDVHWIDPSSRELLDLIVEQVPRQRLLLVMSFRPEFKPPSWADQAHVTTLVLPRLDRDEGTAIIEQIAGDKRLPSEIMDQILAKTDGVPLFVEELTKMILESGLLEDLGDRYALVGSLPLAIPTTLQDSLMARLDRLGRAKEVAQVGAAIGQAFSYNLLAAVAPLRGTELQKALDQLGNAGLVLRREGSQQASYAFKHALVQDAAYQSLLHSTRRQLHARIAGVIEERFPETTELEPELLAHQCTQASLVDKAVSYRLKSGMRAIERSGAVEAVAQLEKGLDLMPSLPSGPERDRQELGLQAAMAAVLVGARGYAAPETNKTLLRARELCERTRDRARTLSVLFLQSALHIVRAEFHAVRNLGEEMQRLGQEWDDSAARLMGGHQLGVGLFSLGEFALARAQFEEVLALYDPEQHRPLTFLYAQNPQVTALCFLSCILFPLGYPEQALRRREEALAHSAELTHFNTTAFALVWACVLDQLRRDRQAVRERSESLISLCTEQRLFFWLATGHMFHGWALADGGEPAAGIAELRQGLAAWRAIGSEYFLPKLIEMQVEAQYRAGEPAGPALDLLSDALSVADKTGEGWLVPELHRLRGNFLLSLSVPDGIAAEASFQQALETARAQGTKMWELRAATCLAQLWRDQGRKADAYDLLAPVYAWFNEGFDTPDLKEAKAILGELRA